MRHVFQFQQKQGCIVHSNLVIGDYLEEKTNTNQKKKKKKRPVKYNKTNMANIHILPKKLFNSDEVCVQLLRSADC